jgi:hypothetical protein
MAEIRLKQRSDTPAAVADNVVLFTDTSGNLNLRKPDGSILALAAAGNFTLTIPATGTAALLGTAQTFSEAQTFSVNPIMSGARPAADGTAAFRILKADNTTPVLTVDTTNSQVIAAGDVFANNDTSGLMSRLVNTYRTATITDHFTATSLAGAWSWASSPFGGEVSDINLTAFPSVLRLTHSNISDDLFLYRTGVSVHARVFVAAYSYIGVRVDDGTADNSIEFRVQSSANSLVTLSSLLITGGGAATVTPLLSDVMSEWFTIHVRRRGTSVGAFVGMSGPVVPNVYGAGGQSWTATRAGIIFGQRAVPSNVDRAGFVDWVEIS